MMATTTATSVPAARNRTGEVSTVEPHHAEPPRAPTPRTASRFSPSSRRTTSGSISYLQVDPQVQVPQLLAEPYSYATSSPLKFTDPTGLYNLDPGANCPTPFLLRLQRVERFTRTSPPETTVARRGCATSA